MKQITYKIIYAVVVLLITVGLITIYGINYNEFLYWFALVIMAIIQWIGLGLISERVDKQKLLKVKKDEKG